MEGVRSRWPFALLEHAGHGEKRTIEGHSAALDRASCSVDSCDGRAFSNANSGQLAPTGISALRDAVQYESDDDDSTAPADLHPPTFDFGVSQTASGPSSPQQDLSLSDKSCQSNILKGSSMSRTFPDWQGSKQGTGMKTLARLGSDFSAVSCAFGSGSSSGTADSDSSQRGAGCAESAKLSAQYKGVVPQPNGRWGAQIYDKNQRIWLGTFSREEEAARAYDRAVWKYRGRDAIINFKSKKFGDAEEIFLSRLSREQVVDMLRRHTFEEELEQSKRQDMVRSCTQGKSNVGTEGDDGGRRPWSSAGQRDQANAGADIDLHAHSLQGNPASLVTQDVFAKDGKLTQWKPGSSPSTTELARVPSNWVSMRSREHLFEKSLTPSDVGKLNRLVIPKQHAERCFPLGSGNNEKGMMLSLEDAAGKIWRFRYSYWASSQSYVFTKGWSGFVKEKKLEAGDIVRFDRSMNNGEELFISCRRRPSALQAATTCATADRLRMPSAHHPRLAHRDLSMRQQNALSSLLQGSAAEASFPAYHPHAWLDSASGCEFAASPPFTNSHPQDLREEGGLAHDPHDQSRRLNLQRSRGCTVDFLSAEDHTRTEIGELGLQNVSVGRASASSLHYSNNTDRFYDLQRRCAVSRIYIDGAPDVAAAELASAPCDLGQREVALRHGSTMHPTAPNLEGTSARTGLRLFGVDVKPGVSNCEERRTEKGWKRDSSAQEPGSFSSAETNSKRSKPSQGFQ